MINDRKLNISTAGSRYALQWRQEEIYWSALCDRLKVPQRTKETYADFMKLPKSEQDHLKDVGGFVGGTLFEGRRKAANVTGRDLVALDFDNIPAGETEKMLKRIAGLGCASMVYSTRKHAPHAPRLRILLPSNRTMHPDEYEPVARKLASLVGIEHADPTTFEAVRLMYYPSCSIDSEYAFEVNDLPFFDVDGVLKMYADWRDVPSWPQVPGSEIAVQRLVAKQQDPEEKRGVVGAFCRTYDIFTAMDRFIPKAYEPTGQTDRFTYLGGSTTGGAIIYDEGRFLYSHHATDPTSGQLVNAWDLVRLHLFSNLDNGAKPGTPIGKLPSYLAMKELALSVKPVTDLMNRERVEAAREAFTGEEERELNEPDNLSWMDRLSKNSNGNIDRTIQNIILILTHDPGLAGRFALDEFANRGVVLGALPWDRREDRRLWADVDDAGMAWYLETFYGITGSDKIDSALQIVSHDNRFHEIRDYLDGLEWDGESRLDALLTEYLGADNNEYTRAVMRKSLCAAVARIRVPGTKYDYMPIFTGPQGIGKSTFLSTLAGEWFSDSLQTFSGKDAAEMIQGVWINELGELAAFSKQETNAVKQFLSKRDDIYREAYGRRTNRFPRQCIFFGTSNDQEFLKDATGNRRFWPVEVGEHRPLKSVWEDLPREVDQIWAEAVHLYELGEPLYLSGEAEWIAREQQEAHRESNAKEGVIRDFIEREIPIDWDNWDVPRRKMYWQGQVHGEKPKTMPRDRVCAAEVFVECFGSDIRFMKRMDSAEINTILSTADGWKRHKSSLRFGPHGTQRGFVRVNNEVNFAVNKENNVDKNVNKVNTEKTKVDRVS